MIQKILCKGSANTLQLAFEMATTRLDRLILLLDTGSSPATRRVAAEQLGEVVKFHPHDLQKLLCRLHTMLRAESLPTRTAAGYAIGAIARNVPKVLFPLVSFQHWYFILACSGTLLHQLPKKPKKPQRPLNTKCCPLTALT